MIFMDTWHRKTVLEAIARFYGYTIIWLPTYSPDKNRIEQRWANLKFWLRYNIKNYVSVKVAVIWTILIRFSYNKLMYCKNILSPKGADPNTFSAELQILPVISWSFDLSVTA